MDRSIQRTAILMWSFVTASFLGVAGIALTLFISPPPATFSQVEMLTPLVRPTDQVMTEGTGMVRMRAHVDSPFDPKCLTSTQYFIEVSDGRMWKLPGSRLTTYGEMKDSIYQAAVPVGSPSGPAWFYVLDTYNCDARVQRVTSPKTLFMIENHK